MDRARTRRRLRAHACARQHARDGGRSRRNLDQAHPSLATGAAQDIDGGRPPFSPDGFCSSGGKYFAIAFHWSSVRSTETVDQKTRPLSITDENRSNLASLRMLGCEMRSSD